MHLYTFYFIFFSTNKMLGIMVFVTLLKSFVKVPVKKDTNEDCESYYVSINQIRTLEPKASGLVYYSDDEMVNVLLDECDRLVITDLAKKYYTYVPGKNPLQS